MLLTMPETTQQHIPVQFTGGYIDPLNNSGSKKMSSELVSYFISALSYREQHTGKELTIIRANHRILPR
jgi:hypothetical protein